jgi:putative ABC transport system permease protein
VSRSNRPVNWHRFTVVGRLRDGTSLEAAQADLAALTAQLPEVAAEAYHPEFMEEAQFAVELVPLREQVVGEVARVLWILLGAVGLVLLIACVNVANLFIVRLATRRREIAVRTALGATRGDIVRRFGGETVLLGLAGGTLGLGLAWAMMRVVVATEPGWIPRLAEVGLGWQAVAFALGVAILAGAAFGAMPALRRDPDHQTLRESGATSASPAQIAVRRALVSAQVGVAVVLLAGAALMLESYRNLMGVHPGFEPRGVLTAQIALPFARYGSYEQANGVLARAGRGGRGAARRHRGGRDPVPPHGRGGRLLHRLHRRPGGPGAKQRLLRGHDHGDPRLLRCHGDPCARTDTHVGRHGEPGG